MPKFPSPKDQAEYERQLHNGLRDAELSGIEQKLREIKTDETVIAHCMELIRENLAAAASPAESGNEMTGT